MKRFAAVVFLISSASSAHEAHQHPDKSPAKAKEHGVGDHEHVSPHGGIVATIDKDTHVEIVFTDKAFAAYFYDANMKPIPLPTDAKATVALGKEVKKLDLPVAKKADGTPEEFLIGSLAVPADQKVAIVIQATLLGKSRTARVERKVAAPAASAPANPTKGTP